MLEPPKMFSDARHTSDVLEIESLAKLVYELDIQMDSNLFQTFETLVDLAGTKQFLQTFSRFQYYLLNLKFLQTGCYGLGHSINFQNNLYPALYQNGAMYPTQTPPSPTSPTQLTYPEAGSVSAANTIVSTTPINATGAVAATGTSTVNVTPATNGAIGGMAGNPATPNYGSLPPPAPGSTHDYYGFGNSGTPPELMNTPPIYFQNQMNHPSMIPSTNAYPNQLDTTTNTPYINHLMNMSSSAAPYSKNMDMNMMMATTGVNNVNVNINTPVDVSLNPEISSSSSITLSSSSDMDVDFSSTNAVEKETDKKVDTTTTEKDTVEVKKETEPKDQKMNDTRTEKTDEKVTEKEDEKKLKEKEIEKESSSEDHDTKTSLVEVSDTTITTPLVEVKKESSEQKEVLAEIKKEEGKETVAVKTPIVTTATATSMATTTVSEVTVTASTTTAAAAASVTATVEAAPIKVENNVLEDKQVAISASIPVTATVAASTVTSVATISTSAPTPMVISEMDKALYSTGEGLVGSYPSLPLFPYDGSAEAAAAMAQSTTMLKRHDMGMADMAFHLTPSTDGTNPATASYPNYGFSPMDKMVNTGAMNGQYYTSNPMYSRYGAPTAAPNERVNGSIATAGYYNEHYDSMNYNNSYPGYSHMNSQQPTYVHRHVFNNQTPLHKISHPQQQYHMVKKNSSGSSKSSMKSNDMTKSKSYGNKKHSAENKKNGVYQNLFM